VYFRCHALKYDYLQHFFGSFLARDDAYRVIVDGWEQHVSDARLLSERQVSELVSINLFCANKLQRSSFLTGYLYLLLYCTIGCKVSK
jgi:hypothetical protein